MILRRLMEHVRTQNWFAVALDFVIVVAGIWVALMAGQWSEGRQKRIDLALAEREINLEIAMNYYNAYERLSIAPCRKARYAELGEMLLEPDPQWPGSPGPYGDGILTKHRVFPPALRSSLRYWTSQAWDGAFAQGTLDILEQEKRSQLTSLFETVKSAAATQNDIYRIESRLQVLTYPSQMTMSDRLRYYDALAEADAISAGLELFAEQITEQIESDSLLNLPDDVEAEMRAAVAAANTNVNDPYGDCRSGIVLPLLQTEAREEDAE
ncbi:MAG: hypothetical protein AAF668_05815 [Pseudomonadota bacterium]